MEKNFNYDRKYAAILTTFSFLPQALQVIKTRNTEGISLRMYAMFVLGAVLWSIYVYTIGDRAILISNFITSTLASRVLYYKIRYTIRKIDN